MLLVDDLSKSWGRNAVLRGASFVIDEGSITALVGPNGAGKSTLLHILVGLERPDHGTVSLDGVPLERGEYRARLGFCPDDLPQAELLTGREYLDMVAGIRGIDAPRAARDAMVQGMRLDRALDRLIAEYSHGMKRKLQIVAALLHTPRLLVLDEPFRGLDPESSAILKTLLRVYAARGNSVLMSTHDLLVADQLSDSALVLSDGRVLSSTELIGSGDDAVTLEEAFLRATGLDRTSAASSEAFFAGFDALGGPR